MMFRGRVHLVSLLALVIAGCSSSSTTGSGSTSGAGGTLGGVSGGAGSGGTSGSPNTAGSSGSSNAAGNSGSSNVAGSSDGGELPGAIPIVAGTSADVPYQFGDNPYGIQGAAFFARAPMGSDSVMVDKTQTGKVCLNGTVEIVPTPADNSHPPYSTYWGVALGFNLNQTADTAPNTKPPWLVSNNVIGFWFTVDGATIPPIRFKTTPTGRDPAQEQDSCALVAPTSGVPNQVLFKDMYVQCWDGPEGTATTDTSKGLLDVSLQVAATVDAPIPLDFCLTGFGVITE